MRRSMILSLLFILTLRPLDSLAFAWGVKGHTWTTDNAIALLPAGALKQYLHQHSGELIIDCLVPDFQWKDGAIRVLESPEHYIDLDNIFPEPRPELLPRNRTNAQRLYNRAGIAFRNGGFLPWRIEEMELALVNAFRTRSKDIVLLAGILSHYAADAAQPLHTTRHFDGRADRIINEKKFLQGIHADYEITFVEDCGVEFRLSARAAAPPVRLLDDIFAAAVQTIFDSFAQVDRIYEVAARYRGEDKYNHWQRELGPMTRKRLGVAASFVASLWLTAWTAAGEPDISQTP